MMHRLAAAWLVLAGLAATSPAGEIGLGSNRMTPVVRAVQRTRPAVVNIHSQKNVPGGAAFAGAMGGGGRANGMGTGVLVDPRGYILTNHHVIEDVTALRVTLVDGATYSAEVVARDQQTDLALLQIRATSPLPTMPMGTSEDVLIGETVVAIGNAFGYEHTTTVGYISELHRDVKLSDEQSYRNLIQTDAAINPGNSGGPLINVDGEMIGLNVAIRAGAQNIGFAIPVDEVKQVLAKLISVQRLRRTYHGIACKNARLSDRQRGRVVVKRVDSGSPADVAGLQPEDRIVSVGDVNVTASFDLERALLDKRPGERTAIVFIREGAERSVPLVLATAPVRGSDPGSVIWRRLGMRMSDSNAAVSEVRRVSSAQLNGGLNILEIGHNSPAEAAGVRPGDIFVGVDDREIVKMENLIYMLQTPALNGSAPVKFWLVRSGKLHWGMLQVLPEE
jgi:serine protease Do